MDKHIEINPKIDELPGALKDLANVVGVANAVKISREFSGVTLYIPSVVRLEIAERDRQMRNEYDQGNTTVQQLARKYRVSERHIGTILCG